MAVNIAGLVEKEYGDTSFPNPSLVFGYDVIGITEKMDIYQKIFLAFSTVVCVAILFFLNPPFVFAILVIASYLFSVAYNYYEVFDKIEIDFINKEITLNNRFEFVNYARKRIGSTSLLRFQDISHFETETGKFSFNAERGSRLVVKSFDHSPLTLATFRFERDARRLGELLQYYVVGKDKLNK